MPKEFPIEYKEMLDMNNILNNTKNLNNLKVILKKDKTKGTGLYATKFIEKGETIAYYRMKSFNWLKYTSPTHLVYAFDIYTSTGRESKNLIGDIDETSIPAPRNNIPYWAPFVNEPFPNQEINAEIDPDLSYNYRNKQKSVANRYYRYKLVALKDIKPGEEIMIDYGEDYVRDY